MTNLQKFIREHREEFDDSEPSKDHFERFAVLLDEQSKTHIPAYNRSQLLKIAALILLLIGLSAIIFDFATQQIRSRFASVQNNTELPEEIREVIQYYDSHANVQLAALGNLTVGNKDAVALNESVLREIGFLDASTAELKINLADNPGNERIEAAIIRNQQMKESILNTIINEISNKSR
ncbi:MAG: hypothetical protein NT004_11145 [Bacteroidetes bacterium]|nr:hypothetical protein [Bacteroidota bacterium]